jgi:hypothetical protein
LKKVNWYSKKDPAEIEKMQQRADKISRKQTLESLPAVCVAGLTPEILGPFSPAKLEKNRSR